MEDTKLSLIIPCYNEARNLPQLIERCAAISLGQPIEVILVDNGSSDESPSILAAAVAQHPNLRTARVAVNQGYGFGILSGLREARGRHIGWTHADMQTDPGDALQALELLSKEHDADRIFIKGRRYGRPIGDVFFTVGMSLFETAVLRTPLWDINAQPTIFPRTFFAHWRNPPHDFSLDLYAYTMARRCGLQVRRFPVRFGKRLHGVSHWNINWHAKLKFIKRTLDFTWRLRRQLAEERS